MWDTRYLDDALNVQELDQSASVMWPPPNCECVYKPKPFLFRMPYFDADINVVHMGGKGETSIKHFEVHAFFLKPKPQLNEFADHRGCSLLPLSYGLQQQRAAKRYVCLCVCDTFDTCDV